MQSSQRSYSVSREEHHPAHTQQPGRHAVAYRISTSFFGRRFYMAFFMGTERRRTERLEREGQIHSFTNILLSIVGLAWLVFWISTVVLGLSVIGMYVLKSAAGINLLDGPSFLHPFFYD